MAEALRPGGVYQDGDRFVNANGEPVERPTRAERRGQAEAHDAAEAQIQEAAVAPSVPRRKDGGAA